MESQNHALKRVFGAEASCPEVGELLNSVDRGEPVALDHASVCPRCGAELAMYRAFQAGDVLPEAKPAIRHINARLEREMKGRTASWWTFWSRPFILVPGFAAVLALLVLVHTGTQNPYRHEVSSVERSQAVDMLAPKGDITGIPSVLKWAPIPAASVYRVAVLEVDKTVLWTTETIGTSAMLPPSVRDRVLPGKRLIWTVEAVTRAGVIAANGKQDFRRTPVGNGVSK